MDVTTLAGESTQQWQGPSASMARTFWRMQLHDLLGKPELLRSIEVRGGSLRFLTSSWVEYWRPVPKALQPSISSFEHAWRSYIGSGFDSPRAAPYCSAYNALLHKVLGHSSRRGNRQNTFLAKVLGFENFLLKIHGTQSAFAAATTTFRNPAFLSCRCKGLRKHGRNDPSLLALIAANDERRPTLFYHYRKQPIMKKTDESLLFFPAVDMNNRQQSFRGFDALAGMLLSAWDSRIEERSRLLVDRVLVPLLHDSFERQSTRHTVRILDIGSGEGLFTSRLVARLARSNVLQTRKLDLSLLDILAAKPAKHFTANVLLPSLARTQYISSDYTKYIRGKKVEKAGRFDIVFLFRILHNMSLFKVRPIEPATVKEATPHGRYPVFPHLTRYYQAILRLFPCLIDAKSSDGDDSAVFHPFRVFDPSCLVTPDGRSFLERLTDISSGVLIEDGDLSARDLVDHLARHASRKVRAYDLSRALRLSINHIYWLTKSPNDIPFSGELIWPR